MHIGIYSVLNLSCGGGFERWVSEVALRLLKRGHTITIITTKTGEKGPNPSIKTILSENGVNLLELNNYSKILTIPKITELKPLLRAVKKFDVLYFNNAFAGNDILLYLVKKATGTKVISGYHCAFPNVGNLFRQTYYKTVNKEISKLFDAHHVLNKEMKKVLTMHGYKKVYYIPNGVDTLKFKPAQKEERFTVLFTGRLVYQKGFDVFEHLVDFLNNRYKTEIQFTIVGDGPLSYIARRLQTKYRNVNWLGYVSDQKLLEIYQKSHVLVAPSRYEEFPLTSIEAQACGTPVITSDIPGPRDNIVHGRTGFLIKNSVEEFAKSVLFFKNIWEKDRKSYKEYSKNARKNSLNYDWNVVIKKLERMMQSVV